MDGQRSEPETAGLVSYNSERWKHCVKRLQSSGLVAAIYIYAIPKSEISTAHSPMDARGNSQKGIII